MSIEVLDRILEGMGISIGEEDKERLYGDMRRDFSLIGSIDECKHLGEMFRDPRARREIEEYIKRGIRENTAWSRRIGREERRKEKMEIYA
jgi:hypothetical protein